MTESIDAKVARVMNSAEEWAMALRYYIDGYGSQLNAEQARQQFEAALRTELVGHAVQGEPVLQIKQYGFTSMWVDCSQSEYSDCETEKRTLYTTPQPASQSILPKFGRAWFEGSQWVRLDDVQAAWPAIAQPEQPGLADFENWLATTPKPAQAEPMASPYVTQAQLDRAFPAPVAQKGDAKDAERLDWLLHNLSGKALRDVKVIADSGGLYFGRIAIDKAIASQKGGQS